MSGHSVEKDATIRALVRALEKRHGKGKKWPLPTIPIGTRVRVHDSGAAGVGTVVGRDGYGFDGVSIIFDVPPRGFEEGCCAGVEQCEVLAPPPGGAKIAGTFVTLGPIVVGGAS